MAAISFQAAAPSVSVVGGQSRGGDKDWMNVILAKEKRKDENSEKSFELKFEEKWFVSTLQPFIRDCSKRCTSQVS
jgi:hypothetical protein